MKRYFARIWSVAVVVAPLVVGVLIGNAAFAGETPRTDRATETAPASPALDLEALAERLRETDAVGVFAKLAIERDVMDLAREFQRYHEGDKSIDLYELRHRFEALRAGIAGRLKNGDPALAGDIAGSGTTLWREFRDPIRFADGIGGDLVAMNHEVAGGMSY